MDHYASKCTICKQDYHCIGCIALLIAAKHEHLEENKSCISDLSHYCCSTYSIKELSQLELHILAVLDWYTGNSTFETWFQAYTMAIDHPNIKAEIKHNGCDHTQEIEEHGIPMEHLDTNVKAVAHCLMEVVQYQEDLIDVMSCAKAKVAMILTNAIYYSCQVASEFAGFVLSH